MSGAEVLGLVTGVMTVICFAAQTAQVCKAVYDGQPSVEQDVARKSSSLVDAMITMKSHCQSFDPSTPDERNLSDIAHKCHEVATALQKEASLIEASEAKGNIFKSLKYSFKKSITGKSKIDKLEKTLRDYETTMQTHLLVRLCTKSDAAKLQQSQHFDNFSESLKQLITQLAADHSALSESIKAEACRTRELTQKQLADTKTSIEDHVSKERQRIITEDQCERFLKSLKHPGMNERRTMVHQAHEETFHWVLQRPRQDIDGNSSIESDSLCERTEPSDDESSVYASKSEETKYWISGKPGAGKSTLIKYLIESPETITTLNKWREGAEIFSHFFWKLGGLTQQNLRGFWGSLTHQRLLSSRDTLEYILSNFPDAKAKDEPSDWSDKEIRDVCLEALSRDRAPLCIFVDGFDEIADSDGAPKLLQAIDDIISACRPNIKVCFASRPEHRFKMRLEGIPEMQIHLLTERDMRRFIKAELSKHFDAMGPSENINSYRWSITKALTDKANGVFIWLVLVLKSLQQGFDNGDSESELFQRIEQMPGDIEKLYEAMWDRLGDNKAFYRTRAADYLSLVAMDIRLREAELRHYDYYPYFRSLSLRLGQVAVAMDPHLCEKSLDIHSDLEPSILMKASEKTRKDIETRCGGLLEVHRNDKESLTWAEEYEEIMEIVTFVHRTAFDYLTTTKHGSEILSAWSSSIPESYISLACGLIGLGRISAREPEAKTFGHVIPWTLGHLREAALNGAEPSTMSMILDTCAMFCDCGIMRPPYWRVHSRVLMAFLSCTLEFDCFETWTLQAILQKGQYHGSLAEVVQFLVSRLYEWPTERQIQMGVPGNNYSEMHAAYYLRMLRGIITQGTAANIDWYRNGMEALHVRARLETWLATCFTSSRFPTTDTWECHLEILADFINSSDDLAARTILRQRVFSDLGRYDSLSSQAIARRFGMNVPTIKPWPAGHLCSIHLSFEVDFANIILHILRCVDRGIESPAVNILRSLCKPFQRQKPVLSYINVVFFVGDKEYEYNYRCLDNNGVQDLVRACQTRGMTDSVLAPFFLTNMEADGDQGVDILCELDKAINCGALVPSTRPVVEDHLEEEVKFGRGIYQFELLDPYYNFLRTEGKEIADLFARPFTTTCRTSFQS